VVVHSRTATKISGSRGSLLVNQMQPAAPNSRSDMDHPCPGICTVSISFCQEPDLLQDTLVARKLLPLSIQHAAVENATFLCTYSSTALLKRLLFLTQRQFETPRYIFIVGIGEWGMVLFQMPLRSEQLVEAARQMLQSLSTPASLLALPASEAALKRTGLRLHALGDFAGHGRHAEASLVIFR
jgi:hypothetical protein